MTLSLWCEIKEGMETSKSCESKTDSCSTKDDIPLLEREQVYRRRWYILLIFSYAAFIQTAIWNTFGPIAQSAKLVFEWTNAIVGMQSNWGNIMFFVFMIPMAWLMDVKGMRISMIVSSTFIMLGAALRCISSEPGAAIWLMSIGSILNGIGGTVPFAGPALVSAIWFPPNQRGSSTSISTVACYLGYSVAFLIGPWLVPEPPLYNLETEVIIVNNTEEMMSVGENVTIATIDHIGRLRGGIMKLLYIECGASVVLFLLVMAYFPSKPPTPPSKTASIERTSYRDGLKQLFKHKQFLLLLLAYSIPTGVVTVFGTVLNVILHKVQISQTTTGWLGFYSVIGGCISQLVLARICDIFLRHTKAMLVVLFVLATASTAWFVAIQIDTAHFNIPALFISYILLGVFVSGSTPLFYEQSCESSYPIAEGVTIGVMTLINNLTGIIFLTVMQIPDIGVLWMNWALLGSVTVTVPLLLLFKATYTRTNIDTEIIVPKPDAGHTDKPTSYHTDDRSITN